MRHLRIAALAAAVLALVAATVAAAAPKPSFPHRIVSLSPTATEDLFAIGAGPQVVAVDDQSDYPKSAPRTKLSGFKPNLEAIASYRPDLVVASNDIGGLVKGLGKLHIPVRLQTAAATLDDVYAQIRELGAATGHEAPAKALVERMRRRIAALVASVPRPARAVSVYHELSPDFYSATSRTFIGRIYALFGLRNIADGAAGAGDYPQLSAEYVVSANPDAIFLADTRCCGITRAQVAARPGWGTIAAVQHGVVVPVDDAVASRWGPRVVDFARAVAAAMRALPAR